MKTIIEFMLMIDKRSRRSFLKNEKNSNYRYRSHLQTDSPIPLDRRNSKYQIINSFQLGNLKR